MPSLVKKKQVLVKLSEAEDADLRRLVRLRRPTREAQFGRATVLRELAMERVREELAREQVAA